MDDKSTKKICDEALRIKALGYNCAQAVVGALAPVVGMDLEIAYRMMAGFGGGMRHKQLCGAVLAAGVILGMRFGSSKPDKEVDKKVKKVILELVDAFILKHKSTVCKDLLEDDPGDFSWELEEDTEGIKDFNLKSPICGEAITDAVRITLEIIDDNAQYI